MSLAPTIKLNNGQHMPVLGLGTYLSTNDEGYNSTKIALDNGYRHIDTAYFYQNENEIGRAVNEKVTSGELKREEIFVVTKLWNIHHDPIHVEAACRKSLKNLGLDYIDLYLIHTPMGLEYREPEELLPKDKDGNLAFSDVDYLDTWKAMEKLVDLGLVKSIGVSNFNSEQIARILENCRIKPVTNQVECSPSLNQKKLIEFCKERNITITGYSPLTRPHSYENDKSLPKPAILDPKVEEIGRKYNKTPAQVVLRYLVEIGACPYPKSSNESRIKQNIEIFDFKLTENELRVMDSFHTGQRTVPFAACAAHKYFMLNREF
ncbi:CLUMA_CG008962, isoform A [Clunio marinus]|uniref:CLUMA_CG008962, isoform A n=1 Tax=Clunio marinus TaxID=568069 RepID=A0A1J1I5D0_9DIPT|nr:CLUMA_CG008962, isoform A [Clunio marinus]